MYISQRDVTVAVVDRRETVWVATTSLGADEHASEPTVITDALGLLLDRVPRTRWPVLRVNTSLGMPWARLRLVKGMPPVSRRGELVSMLRLNTNRFIAASRPVLITGAIAVSPGEASVGVADRSMVDAVTHEIMKQKLRIGQITPAALLEFDERLHGLTSGEPSRDEPLSSEAMAAAAATGSRGISRGMSGGMSLGLRPQDNPAGSTPDASRKRVAIAGVALAAAGLIYMSNQLNAERLSLGRNEAAVRAIATVSDSGMREEAELGQLNRDLASAANFSRHRVSTALLLGAITEVLPEEAAITTLRIDTANVDIVTVSTRTAAVVDALSDVANLAAPTIVGPVSRETVGARELERATIRLRILPDYGRGKTRFVTERDGDNGDK